MRILWNRRKRSSASKLVYSNNYLKLRVSHSFYFFSIILKLFQCEEKDFYQLHELIIKKASGKFSPINVSSQNHYGLAITLKLLLGSLAQAKSEQPLLFEGTTLTKKMG
jgi:DOCK N-terminus